MFFYVSISEMVSKPPLLSTRGRAGRGVSDLTWKRSYWFRVDEHTLVIELPITEKSPVNRTFFIST